MNIILILLTNFANIYELNEYIFNYLSLRRWPWWQTGFFAWRMAFFICIKLILSVTRLMFLPGRSGSAFSACTSSLERRSRRAKRYTFRAICYFARSDVFGRLIAVRIQAVIKELEIYTVCFRFIIIKITTKLYTKTFIQVI